jgi:hypothetical protein
VSACHPGYSLVKPGRYTLLESPNEVRTVTRWAGHAILLAVRQRPARALEQAHALGRPMHMGGRSIAALVLGASLAAGCGSTMGGEGSGPVGPSVPTVVTITPGGASGGEGIPMRSAADMTVVARNRLPDPSALPFNAAFPSSAGTPLVAFVYDPVQHRAGVDAEYDASSPYGAFRLREERSPAGTVGDLVTSVAGFCNDGGDAAGSGCTSAIVDVNSGLRGAILYGPNGDTSVTVVDRLNGRDYTLIVMGPGATFTPERAEAAMRDVVAHFDPLG